MYIADYVGKIVILKISRDFIKDASNVLQPNNPDCSLFYARIASSDQLGLWIENGKWRTQDHGTDSPVTHKAIVLVPWNHIISVAVFPERKFDSEEGPENSGIGFLATI